MPGINRRRDIVLWQLSFLMVGTSWLWAPYLNHGLSYRTALISHYEASGQPYAWLFRLGDALAALLLIWAAANIRKLRAARPAAWLLLVLGAGMLLDPLLPTTCHLGGAVCNRHLNFSWHAAESVMTTLALLGLTAYDSFARKKIVSYVFLALQLGFIASFLTQLNSQHFNTAVQYVYEAGSIVWLAWYVRDRVFEKDFTAGRQELRYGKVIAAAWAFLNGILAILVSLAHIHLLGRIRGLYFAGDTAWLAQHGVVVGVVMIYLSRHLYRGERRARQIFLAVAGIEVLKYAVIAPDAGLLALYSLTFAVLFVARDDFDRGTIALTWQMRLRDLYVLAAGTSVSVVAAFILLDRDNKAAVTTQRAIDHFSDYVENRVRVPHSHLTSALLAHTISVFILAVIASVLWVLFKPYGRQRGKGSDLSGVRANLRRHSKTTEDYFKLWPEDKEYYWDEHRSGFIAYKIAGPIAFALADPTGPRPTSLLEDFRAWCKSRRLTVCFLPIAENSLPIYQMAGMETIQIGASAQVDVKAFLTETVNDKWWRWKRNRAQKSGYEYRAAKPPHSDDFMARLEDISSAWLASGHEERGFALGYFDRAYLARCEINYLVQDGRPVAFANQVPPLRRMDVATVDLMRHLPEADDAMPYLLQKTIEELSQDKQLRYFDLGFVPFAGVKGPLLTIAQTMSAGRFSAKGLEQFKNKFKPDWQSSYLAYDGDIADLASIALNLESVMQVESDKAPVVGVDRPA